jgi:hypothetical protein
VGGLGFQRQVHALVAAVLLGMSRGNSFELNAEAQPPDRQLAEPVQRMRGCERHAVIGTHRLRQPEVLKGALKHAKRVALLRRRERFAGNQIATGKVGDGERLAVAVIGEQELAFVVGAPQPIRRQRLR